MDRRKLILIAGGGTGGHLYPALAIAQAIKKINPETDVHFVGTALGLEKEIVPKTGFPLHLISGAKLNTPGKIFSKVGAVLAVLKGCWQALGLLFRYRPTVVLGVGGYASAPVVLVAALLGYRTYLWEPNAHPGLANRWLSRFVKHAIVVFDRSRSYLKSSQVLALGMPVRAEIENAAVNFRTPGVPFHLLVFGGSQGAKSLNTLVFEMLQSLRVPVHLVHQVGAQDWDRMKEMYSQKYKARLQGEVLWVEQGSLHVECRAYLHDMPERYKAADLVIARSGASTLAELAAFAKPSILIPLAAADDHQAENARVFQEKSAALLLKQTDLTPVSLAQAVETLLQDAKKLHEMSDRARHLFQAKGAQKIAETLLS